MTQIRQRPQWEYLEVFVDLDKKSWKDGTGRSRKLKKGQLGEALAELGREGWELAGTLPHGSADEEAWMFFKRPLIEGQEPSLIVDPTSPAVDSSEASERTA